MSYLINYALHKQIIESDIWDNLQMGTYKKGKIVHMDLTYSIKLKVIADTSNPLKIKSLVMEGNWNQFGLECGFEEGKMMRIKLFHYELHNEDAHNKTIPIFHVC